MQRSIDIKGKKHMRIKVISFLLAILCLSFAAGCGRSMAEDGNTGQSVTNSSEDAAQPEASPVTPEEGASGNAPETMPVQEQPVAAPEEVTETVETVEYSHDALYLSIDIPDGWDYQIRTVEELEKYDGMALCAIEFWSKDYPETVFTLDYETAFGICGTGVTIEEFTWENGLHGYRYTEEIEDTLWLTMTLRNPDNDTDSGTYCIMACPALSVWDVIQPEFEEIAASVWVGSHRTRSE